MAIYTVDLRELGYPKIRVHHTTELRDKTVPEEQAW